MIGGGKENDRQDKKFVAYWKKIVILLCMGWVTIWIYRSALSPVYPQNSRVSKW